jgi:hypothetical protein
MNHLKHQKMKNLIMFLGFIIIISCKTDHSKTQLAIASIDTQVQKLEVPVDPVESPSSSSNPYNIKLDSHKLDNDTYDLEIRMELNDGAHFVSPNSKGNYTGIFTVVIDENDKIERSASILETPLSVEEFDPHPFTNGYINWVRINTTYKQEIKRNKDGDFEVRGHIQFTIEPRCSLEKIPFIIKYKNGEMKFEVFGC